MATESEARQIAAARNQSLYREVNERVRSLDSGWMSMSDEVGFVCECADESCALPLTLTLAEYEAVRARIWKRSPSRGGTSTPRRRSS